MTPEGIFIVAGSVLLLIGLVGGGIKSQYMTLGKVAGVARVLCGICGVILVLVGTWLKIRPTPSTDEPAKSTQSQPKPQDAPNTPKDEGTKKDPDAPVFHDDPPTHHASLNRMPWTPQLRRMMIVDAQTIDDQDREDVRIGRAVDEKKSNAETGKGLTLDNFALNTDVSCWDMPPADHESPGRALKPVPTWWRDSSCDNKPFTDPIFDVVVTNHTDEIVVMTGIEVFAIEAAHGGGDESGSPTSPILKVAARYNVAINAKMGGVYRQDMMPPLQLRPHQPQRFQLRFLNRERCFEEPGYCSMYARLRMGFEFGQDRSLVTKQFGLVF